MSVSEMLRPWEGQDLVPLHDLALSVGLDANAQHYARKNHMFTPAARGPNGRYLITWEDAALIAAASLIALAAGIAIVTALGTLAGAGAKVIEDRVVIPLCGTA